MGKTIRKEPLETFARRKLLERQRSLVERSENNARDAQAFYAEPETDSADRAGDVSAAENLEHLGESERAQLGRVVAALGRIADGTWGRCLVCGGPIAEQRLRAVPEAVRCSGCTNHHL